MWTARDVWSAFAGESRAVTSIEYALIGMLVAAVIVVAMAGVSTGLTNIFTNIANDFASAAP